MCNSHITSSPDGKKVVDQSENDEVSGISNLDAGKFVTKWTKNTKRVSSSICRNQDSRLVESGSRLGRCDCGIRVLSQNCGMQT